MSDWKEVAKNWERAAEAWRSVPDAFIDGAFEGAIIGLAIIDIALVILWLWSLSNE